MAHITKTQPLRILRLPQVMEIVGVSRSTIYLWIQQESFPRPLKLSVRRVGWLESDVMAWIRSKSNTSVSQNSFLVQEPTSGTLSWSQQAQTPKAPSEENFNE